jgi:hypothetical protein
MGATPSRTIIISKGLYHMNCITDHKCIPLMKKPVLVRTGSSFIPMKDIDTL